MFLNAFSGGPEINNEKKQYAHVKTQQNIKIAWNIVPIIKLRMSHDIHIGHRSMMFPKSKVEQHAHAHTNNENTIECKTNEQQQRCITSKHVYVGRSKHVYDGRAMNAKGLPTSRSLLLHACESFLAYRLQNVDFSKICFS